MNDGEGIIRIILERSQESYIPSAIHRPVLLLQNVSSERCSLPFPEVSVSPGEGRVGDVCINRYVV